MNISKKLLSDTNAASIVTEHITGLLLLLLLTGVMLGSIGTMFTERSETVTESELERINNKVANDIQQVDSMVNYGIANGGQSNTDVTRRVVLSPSIGTTTYTVSVRKESSNEATVITQSANEKYTQQITTDIPLQDNSWGGTEGAIISYDNNNNVITISDPEDYSP